MENIDKLLNNFIPTIFIIDILPFLCDLKYLCKKKKDNHLGIRLERLISNSFNKILYAVALWKIT